VWAHWVWCKYAVDFLRQDGEWKIWKFRCYELSRAPFEENWISFAEKNAEAFDLDLCTSATTGSPSSCLLADQPVPSRYSPYHPDDEQTLEPAPPLPRKFEDTIE
jgi:hypothetical protein